MWILSPLLSLRSRPSSFLSLINIRLGNRNKSNLSTHINLNYNLIGYYRESSYKSLLSYSLSHHKNFNDINWATSFSSLGRLHRRTDRSVRKDGEGDVLKLMKRLEERIERESGIDWLNPQAVANLVHAFGVMSLTSPLLKDSVLSSSSRLTRECSSQEISNILYGFAVNGGGCEEFVDQVNKREVVERVFVESGKAQAYSNTVWSIAKMGLSAPTIFEAVNHPKVLSKIVDTGGAQHISNTVWAMAVTGSECRGLCEALNEEGLVNKIVEEGNNQAVSNCLYGLAKLDFKGVKLVEKIERVKIGRRMVDRRGRGVQNLVNSLWSCATMGINPPHLASIVENPRISSLISSDPTVQHISNVLWSMAKFKYQCPNLIKDVKNNRKGIMEGGNVQEVSNVVCAMSELGYFEDNVFDEAAKQGGKFNDISSLGDVQSTLKTLYGFSIAGKMSSHSKFVTMLWTDLAKVSNLGKEHLRVMELVRLYAISEGVKLSPLDAKQGGRMIEAARETTDGGVSQLEKSVIGRLKDMGYVEFVTEHSPFAGEEGGDLLKIDVAFPSSRVALELDGPTHFVQTLQKKDNNVGGGGGNKTSNNEEGGSRARVPDGPTRAKGRLLKSLGWKVLKLSYVGHMDMKRRGTWEKVMGRELDKVGVERG